MRYLTFVFAAAFSLAALPALAGAPIVPNNSMTLAQADVTIGPNGIGIGDRDHDRGHDRDRVRHSEERDHDRGCRTVTVEERRETRTTRRCD